MTIDASLAVVIVNYGAGDFIISHLDKTLRGMNAFREAHIYIADNASPNDDLQKLQEHVDANNLSGRVTAFATGGNLGFAGGNNAAFARFATPPDYVFFLNPDAWPKDGALERLAETLAQNPKAAIAAPRIMDENGKTAVSYFKFPKIADQFGSEAEINFLQKRAGWSMLDLDTEKQPIEADWVSGAAFLLRTEAAEAPPMDDGYFLYFEETDMMRALRDKGWRILLDPAASVLHVGGLTTGSSSSVARDKRMSRHWYASWARYHLKHFGRVGALLTAALKVAGALVFYVKMAFRPYKPWRPKRYLRDFLQYAVWPLVSFKRL